MNRGLENASAAMIDKMKNIQVVANNLANANTTGFKRGLPFEKILDAEKAGLNRKLVDFSEGTFIETNNPLNAAISGEAFFTVNTPNGEQITKSGDFVLDKEGYLATRDGYRLVGQNGEINLQSELINKSANITITKNGEVKSEELILTKLKIVKVENEYNLKKSEGQRYYNDDGNYKIANEEEYQINQGYLEASNTNAILEMQSMIQLQKDYEASQKMISSIDNMMGQVKEMGRV